LIVGAGALGTLFAARLSSAGVAVTVLDAWQEAVDALNKNGATLSMGEQESIAQAYPINAVTQCEKAELALVLVKSWQTEEIARQLEVCLAPDGLAITLQNGLGNAEILASALGAERVVQGVTTTGAALIAPGVARAGGEGLVSLEAHPRLGAFTALLTEAGFQSEVVPSAASLVWGKLVINAAINPLTALLNIPNGELLKRPSARKLMGNLARETVAVAAAQNIPLGFANPVQVVEEVAKKTATNFSSMLQDVRRGAPTEIDAICGAVAQIGQKLGVPTPLNETMKELVKARVEVETW
jgi:2-dehydropantoate 2-reductase